MRKRILTVALSIMMAFCISLLAFAEGNGTPPEMPSGDMIPPDAGNGQPPEKPDGDMTPPGSGNGRRPDKPNGEGPGTHGDAPVGNRARLMDRWAPGLWAVRTMLFPVRKSIC